MVTHLVSAVDSYSLSDAAVELQCRLETPGAATTDDDRTVPVRIRFYAPDVFRFEMLSTPENPTAGSPISYDIDAVRRPVSLSATESDGTLRVETTALSLRIGLEEWAFEVRADGDRLLRERRDDRTAKGERRTQPLRFVEEEVNRWPLRVTETGTAFGLGPDERVFGLGEKFTDLDKRGRVIESWVTQPNGTETEFAHKNVPLYLSTRGYGLLADTARKTTFDFGASSSGTIDLRVEGDALRFFFFTGDRLKELLRRYTALTGRPHRPERWTFGVWMSRLSYQSRDELESVAETLREREIPCDVLHVDPYWMDIETICDLAWDEDAFPDPEAMIESLADRGFKLSLWEYPYVRVDSPLFEEFADRGYLVEDGTGSPYVLSRLSVDDRGGIVDFTDPDAREWWAERHRELAESGVDVFKLDFGEYLPRDAVLSNGKTGAAMRNRYPRLYYETVQDALRAAGRERPTLWVRSGWIGDQVFPIHWGGDPDTTFEAMAANLRGGLSLGLSGYPFWATDIGGFRGEPTPELYVRWAQWGLLGTSHARFHGTTPREPWHFGEDAEAIVRDYAKERYRLLPYLYTYAERAARTGLPVMRPLVLEFEDDPAARAIDTQYLLGEELLIAPILRPGGRREVYLPEGEWVDYWSGARYDGGRSLDVDVPLDTMPAYVRAGSIVPYRTWTQHLDGDRGPIHLRVEFGSSGETAAPREATFEHFDAGADELVSVTAVHATASDSVTLDVPPDVASARLRRFDDPPAALAVNDDSYERVADDPGPGEWTHDAADGAVQVTVAATDGENPLT
ncbi:alpha-glucosidase [Halorubrum distributum JCM 13561]|uniref:Alpha-glucosidase n=1 Tax=Halorubrum distributum JCM 13561 TaxID=1227483 RepID=M0NQV4_9EURY|nr:TIM-barrel domain-containing protein [Halorubrum litoreum]EMA59988.1 alpha-glucosidase [Halorubrum litoreum JCM 13561]